MTTLLEKYNHYRIIRAIISIIVILFYVTNYNLFSGVIFKEVFICAIVNLLFNIWYYYCRETRIDVPIQFSFICSVIILILKNTYLFNIYVFWILIDTVIDGMFFIKLLINMCNEKD